MNTFWQKCLATLKLIILAILVIHILLFIFFNMNVVAEPHLSLIYKTYERPNFLLVIFLTSVISIFGWWLFRTSYRTIRQIQDSRQRSRTDKLERDMADMRSKASMLQTKPLPGAGTVGDSSNTIR